jgi:hypothetical protein
MLVQKGAGVGARNRRGAEPLHYAAVGIPRSAHWNPPLQVATIAFLKKAGADANAGDANGVTALHRAVRTRCGAAAQALLDRGADPRRSNDSGSTPVTRGRADDRPRRHRRCGRLRAASHHHPPAPAGGRPPHGQQRPGADRLTGATQEWVRDLLRG